MKCLLVIFMISVHFCALAYSTQRPSNNEESSPFLDMASSFLENLSQNGQGGGGGGGGGVGGIVEIASLIGSMMGNQDGKSSQPSGASQIISGIGSLIAANSGGGGGAGGGFDPSMIGNIVQMFAGGNSGGDSRKKRSDDSNGGGGGGGLEAVLSIASSFLSNYNNQDQDDVETNEINYKQEKTNPYNSERPSKIKPKHPGMNGDTLLNLLPIVMQTLGTFSGSEMEKTEAKHKEHGGILPPFLEKIHMAWDHFTNSELSDALYKKIGLDNVFKGFVGRDGRVDYEKLFDSLQNQSFRRRWIRTAVLYLADWANYLSNPEVYQSYFATGQMMLNGFLQSQGFPKNTLFDIHNPSETLSNLINYAVKRNLKVQVDALPYVKPSINYIKDVLKLGKSREMLQKMNTTELSDKLTDTLNLEIIEPILKVHRAYKHATIEPQCDQFILCEINSHNVDEKRSLGGFKSGVTRFGSYAAAWFISEKTQTSFWTLFATINDPYECQHKFPVDCRGFHEMEHKVTTEYPHSEL